MRNVLRKSIALFSMGVFLTGIGVPVKASETEWVQEYGVDEEKYNINWNECIQRMFKFTRNFITR